MTTPDPATALARILAAMPAEQPYQLMPAQDADTYAALKASIAERGILEPIHLAADGRILDGHHRLQAWHELKAAGVDIPTPPVQWHAPETEDLAIELAVGLNMQRRHLSIDEKRAVCQSLAARGLSQYQIVKWTGIPRSTVQRMLAPPAPEGAQMGPPAPAEQDPPIVNAYQAPITASAPTIAEVYDALRPAEARAYAAIADMPANQTTEAEFETFKSAIAALVDGPSPAEVERRVTELASSARPLPANFSSASAEWYTPAKYLTAARAVMGAIDLDPASCALANQTVQAARYYTEAEDGLAKAWTGRVWCNPPYGTSDGQSTAGRWAHKLIDEYRAGRVTEAILLVNASTERGWFKPLWEFPICLTYNRIQFYTPGGIGAQPVSGNAFVYLGPNLAAFVREFSPFGEVVGSYTRRAGALAAPFPIAVELQAAS